MQKLLLSLITVLLLGLVINADGQEKAKVADKIRIVGVSSEDPVRDAVANEFTVHVEYTLDSVDEGVVSIGFNVDKDDPGRYRTFTMKKAVRGSHQVTLKVKVAPKDWKERGDFFVNAILAPANTDSGSYRALAGTKKLIEFEP